MAPTKGKKVSEEESEGESWEGSELRALKAEPQSLPGSQQMGSRGAGTPEDWKQTESEVGEMTAGSNEVSANLTIKTSQGSSEEMGQTWTDGGAGKQTGRGRAWSEAETETKSKLRRTKKRRKEGKSGRRTMGEERFAMYCSRVLKQIHPDLTLSKAGGAVMESMCRDIFERVVGEARTLHKRTKTKTFSQDDIRAAVRLVVGGELATHAISEGNKALRNFHSIIKDSPEQSQTVSQEH